MKSIGGYLDFQLNKGTEYYPDLIKLNTGRNALEYILRIKRYKLVHLPYFTCQAILEPIEKLKLQYQFYTIDEQLDPVLDFAVRDQECFIYTNYFGLKQQTVETLGPKFNNLIIDNSQAFFSVPIEGADTFYSCRKFFGVPDGAYLQTKNPARLKMDKDISYGRCSHLLKSIDLGIEDGYADFQDNSAALSKNPIRKMSSLTQRLMGSIDYKFCKFRRNSNFFYLHEHLQEYNDYVFDDAAINGPMIYPLVIRNAELRARLLENKIYVATYWPNVLEWTTKKMYEHYLTTNLVALPIDHRYNHADMKRIINLIKNYL